MTEPHDIRGRRVLLWLGFLALIVAALALPDAWLAPITSLLGERDPVASAFDDETAELDEALEAGDADLSSVEANRLVPHVVARRLLRAGPMTAEQTREAADIWARAMRAADDEPEEGSPDAHYELAKQKILERFPRLNAEQVGEELEALREQVARARRGPAGGPKSADGELACEECHSRTRPLPDGRSFDLAGIYPFQASEPAYDEGRRLPVLTEALELRAARRLQGESDDIDGAECLTCHVPHGASGFEIGHQDRIDNMGLWVNIIDTSPGALHVEVKVKNADAGHRAPGGLPGSAYVTTVEAFQGKTPLERRFGTRLPNHLRTEKYGVGSVFARHMVDREGSVTTDLNRVADLQFDTRLMSGRFDTENFMFDRVGDSRARVVVTLWYLPDYATWKGAKPVRRAAKPEP